MINICRFCEYREFVLKTYTISWILEKKLDFLKDKCGCEVKK